MASSQDRIALARRNGKPRDANRIAGRTAAMDIVDGRSSGQAKTTDGSIVETGPDGRIYKYIPKFDHTIIMNAEGNSSAPKQGNQLPSGSIDGMIDQVLEMSGMTGGGNVPIPQLRPNDMNTSGMTGTENNPGKLADDMVQSDGTNANMDDDPNNWSTAELLLGALGFGGATAAARALYNQYKSGQTGQPNANGATAGTGATTDADAEDITAVADSDEQKQQAIIDQKTKRLAPPLQQIEGPRNALPSPDNSGPPALPSPIDETINSTMSDEEFDARVGREVGSQGNAPSNQSRFAPSNAPQVDDIIVRKAAELIDQGNIREGFRMLNEAGVEIDERLLQMFAQQSNTAKSLRQRAVDIGGQGVIDAARRSAR